MVAAVRRGQSLRSVARRFRVRLATVQYWVRHAAGQRLDRVDFTTRPSAPRRTRRTDPAMEEQVITARQQLQRDSDLGDHGAAAIHQALRDQGVACVPSVRTIGRILRRRGLLDARTRVRRPPPPRGWYLPRLAARRVELDSFDKVEGLVIKDGPHVEILNGVSLHGGLPASWPVAEPLLARQVVDALVEHWRAWGLPGYAQFDNESLFQGTHTHPDVVGRVTRLCLSLGVTPVFAPPRETGFQAMTEGFNNLWQARVWRRFTHTDLASLQDRSTRYLTALRRHRVERIDAAPRRRRFPAGWRLNLQKRLGGLIIYLRRTNAEGDVELLGRRFQVGGTWPGRLVRAEVDLDAECIRFYALRRREPTQQPLLASVPYSLPHRRFHE